MFSQSVGGFAETVRNLERDGKVFRVSAGKVV
jgi:hypothetical protein